MSTGITCIICHQVLRHPSEHGTSSMRKHLQGKALIAKLNELTESEVSELTSSMVDETAVVILKRQGSQGITIVSSQRKYLFHIPLNQYWLKWRTKRSKLGAKNYEISEFHQDTWNHYVMLRFVLACIPGNAISYLELWWSYHEMRSDLVLLLVTTLSNICWRQYAMTVNAIKKQLPSRNQVSLSLDGWT